MSISTRSDLKLAQRRSILNLLFFNLALVLVYILQNMVFGPRIGGVLGNYILPSLTWGLLIMLVWCLPASRPAGRLRHQRLLRWLALMCVLVFILGLMLQGAIAGFGKTPYSHSWQGVLINIFLLGFSVTALELSRAWLVRSCFRRHRFLGITLVSFLFTFLTLPLSKLTSLPLGVAMAKDIGTQVLPTMARSFLTTYLAHLGGPAPAIIFQGASQLYERLTPFLPNTNWASQTLIGVLLPILSIALVSSIYREEARETGPANRDGGSLGWIFTSLAAVLIIWFAMGVFSCYPRVILSGSMQPGIKIGDIVIINKITGDQAQLGDIILFPYENMKVTHRIIQVQEVQGKRFFITKGDANGDPEQDPLYEKNVLGKVVMVIPKLGWITLWLRGAIAP